jgi:hypothetical protein
MLTSHPLPTLFGRLTSLECEHEHLRTHLERVRALCAALSGRIDTPLPSDEERLRLIVEWQTQLSRHFEAEESPRYFGTLVADRPELIPRIGELRADHAAMLDSLRLLTTLAKEAIESRAFAVRALHLIEQLERHERAESELMREFFEQGGERP